MEIHPVISTDRAVGSRGADLNPQSLKDAGSFTDGYTDEEIRRNRMPRVQVKPPGLIWKCVLMG